MNYGKIYSYYLLFIILRRKERLTHGHDEHLQTNLKMKTKTTIKLKLRKYIINFGIDYESEE
jgi:hypothetical protein